MSDPQTIDGVVRIHGHMRPVLAMGIRAGEVALAEIGPHSGDEEVVAIVETDMCGVDAIQFLHLRQGEPHPARLRQERLHLHAPLRRDGRGRSRRTSTLGPGRSRRTAA